MSTAFTLRACSGRCLRVCVTTQDESADPDEIGQLEREVFKMGVEMRQRICVILAASCLLAGCNKPEESAAVPASQCGSLGAGMGPAGAPGGGGKLAEGQVKQQLTASGETAEVVNQLSWQLCNARTNAWIDDNFYRKEMSLLRESAFDAFAQRAGRSPQEVAQARQRACLTEAGGDEAAQAACKSS